MAALVAASFAITGVLSLCSGCGSETQKAASSEASSAAVSSSQTALNPGVAVVHRDAGVKYSVPEGVSVLMYHMIGNEQGNAAIMSVIFLT